MDYFDLGNYARDITTESAEAKTWFDRGLNWCYGFHHEEAIACFERALAHDPACAMAHWGVAYAIGPNYNKPWEAFDEDDKRGSLERARAAAAAAEQHAAAATPVEQALAGALVHRYPEQPDTEDFSPWTDAYAAAMREVHVAHPGDLDVFCTTTAMQHYAKTVAHAASGDVPAAEAERERFLAARDRVPESRMLFNNTCVDILRVAQEMLDGELEYRRGNVDAAFEHLRRSVELDDNLPYDEPWGWMQPTRHALGALLLEQGRVDEAEAVYRADLGLDGGLSRACQHPDNVWSLHGLHECLSRRGEQAEAVMIRQRLDLANARADAPIKASCFCRQQAA